MGLKLQGEVALDGSGWEAGLKRIEGATSRAAEGLKGFAVSAFGIYGVEQAIHKTLDTAKELITESKRLGVGVEQLQVMKQAAEENNTELETMAKAFEKIDIARAKALEGGPEGDRMRRQLAALGITQLDPSKLSAAQAFIGPLHQAAISRNQEVLGPALRDILGKAFGETIPVLKTDFDELSERMHRLGLIMDTETVVKLKAIDDQLGLIGKILITQFGPVLIRVVETLMKAYAGLSAIVAGAVGFASGAVSGKWDKDRFDKLLAMGLSGGLSLLVPGQNPFDTKEAVKGAKDLGSETLDEWRNTFIAMEQKLKEMANALDNPNALSFNGETLSKTKHTQNRLAEGDSLVRVGNFLGSSNSALQDVAEQQLHVLRQIAFNTAHWGVNRHNEDPGGNFHHH